MKRMTLLTSLIMVFSLFAVTAAIAGPGPGTADGDRVGEPVVTQTQVRAEVHADDAPCVVGDESSECEPVKERTQTREQTRASEPDGECIGTDIDCEAVQNRNRTQARDQFRLNDGNCADESSDCEPVRAMTRTQAYEQIMERVAAYVDGSGEGGYLFAMVRQVWTHMHMHGPLSAMFL